MVTVKITGNRRFTAGKVNPGPNTGGACLRGGCAFIVHQKLERECALAPARYADAGAPNTSPHASSRATLHTPSPASNGGLRLPAPIVLLLRATPAYLAGSSETFQTPTAERRPAAGTEIQRSQSTGPAAHAYPILSLSCVYAAGGRRPPAPDSGAACSSGVWSPAGDGTTGPARGRTVPLVLQRMCPACRR